MSYEVEAALSRIANSTDWKNDWDESEFQDRVVTLGLMASLVWISLIDSGETPDTIIRVKHGYESLLPGNSNRAWTLRSHEPGRVVHGNGRTRTTRASSLCLLGGGRIASCSGMPPETTLAIKHMYPDNHVVGCISDLMRGLVEFPPSPRGADEVLAEHAVLLAAFAKTHEIV
jgi:hypothetical protein